MVKEDKNQVGTEEPFEAGLQEILDAGPNKNPSRKSPKPLYTSAIVFETKKKSKKIKVVELLIRIGAVIAVIGLLFHFAVRIAYL